MNFNRVGIVASGALTLALALPNAAVSADPSADTAAPTSAAAAAPEDAAGAAVPAKATGELGMNYTPTAGVWRDKLIAARKNVLRATAALDDINAEYARALYENSDDADQNTILAKQRTAARQQLTEARSEIPTLVEQARADGVSEQVLDLYEQSLEN